MLFNTRSSTAYRPQVVPKSKWTNLKKRSNTTFLKKLMIQKQATNMVLNIKRVLLSSDFTKKTAPFSILDKKQRKRYQMVEIEGI